jgi:hypothetical protein
MSTREKVKKRQFAPVAKDKSGTPLKYLQGLTQAQRKKKKAEMKSTAEKYKKGTLTKAEMNRISKERAARGKKK